ncbi:hypothetical protein BV898_11355 [Hypsibius exemplaris]|uniref:Receptor-binding cancer antigen expressed on SiSo cells n=1 Tax=Hypsibius exemplaris TaxID=2072580 RepID=A0A1W0WGP6_HYPEX|nr:hypothetical protein BV898_11355 [Hypsibius exemplaris]
MKCKGPFLWFLQLLKNTWRFLFGRKRAGSGSSHVQQSSSSSSKSAVLTGITVESLSPGTSSGLQLANEDTWNSDGQQLSPVRKSFHPSQSLPQQQTAGSRAVSAADVWRQSLLQQKAAPPPEPAEEPNFFDNMAPTVHKQKIVRLRTAADESAAQSSRLAFNAAAAAPVNQFSDWTDNEAPASNWETGIDDLDLKEIRKAQRKAQSSSTPSGRFN